MAKVERSMLIKAPVEKVFEYISAPKPLSFIRVFAFSCLWATSLFIGYLLS